MEHILQAQFKTTDLEALYGLTSDMILEYGGGNLLNLRSTIPELLESTFPNHAWEAWRFNSQRLWMPELHGQAHRQAETTKEFVQHLGVRLGIPPGDLASWYRVSAPRLQAVGARTIVKKLGGLHAALETAYPDHQWEASKFDYNAKKAAQHVLRRAVETLFPSEGTCMRNLYFASPFSPFMRKQKFWKARSCHPAKNFLAVAMFRNWTCTCPD